MRILILILMLASVAGCSAMMASGGSGSAATTSTASSASDASVAAAVRQNLAADSAVSSFELGVQINNGKATLSGTVDSYSAYEQAERIALRTSGVKAIDNQIKVEAK